MKNATQRDMAKKLNLSVTAISKALGGASDISPETRERVLKTAREMGYVSNFMASNIRRSKGNMVGIICSDLTQPYFNYMLGICERALIQANYQPLLFSSYEDAARELSIINQLMSLNVAGCILALAQRSKESVPFLRERGIPFVLFNRWFDEKSDHYVTADDVCAGELATDYLLRRAPERPVLCINGPDNISPTTSRFKGYQNSLRRAGLPVLEQNIFNNCFSSEDGYVCAMKAIERHPEPISVVCSTDSIAIGVLRAMYERGRNVPRDAAVIGVDDIYQSQYMTPSLTTVAQPKREISELSVGMLLDLMNRNPIANPHVLLAPTLVVRETTP